MALFVIISFPLLFLSFLCSVASLQQCFLNRWQAMINQTLFSHTFPVSFWYSVTRRVFSEESWIHKKNHGFVYRPNEWSLLGRKKFIFQNVGFHFRLHCPMISHWVEVIPEGRYLLSGPTLTFPGDKNRRQSRNKLVPIQSRKMKKRRAESF